MAGPRIPVAQFTASRPVNFAAPPDRGAEAATGKREHGIFKKNEKVLFKLNKKIKGEYKR
jgi:hypothetical protein